ncbi:MAG: hypothetical protein EOP83_02190 [Verrucomicrobiaceae bacterium]|nr:MAG: hypothetical protein EOP83_02190 [Verrucomicrobiaceae bacterium]
MNNLHSFDLADLATSFNRMLDGEDFPERETRMSKPSHLMDPPRSSRANPEMEIGVGTSRSRLTSQAPSPIAS